MKKQLTKVFIFLLCKNLKGHPPLLVNLFNLCLAFGKCWAEILIFTEKEECSEVCEFTVLMEQVKHHLDAP